MLCQWILWTNECEWEGGIVTVCVSVMFVCFGLFEYMRENVSSCQMKKVKGGCIDIYKKYMNQ